MQRETLVSKLLKLPIKPFGVAPDENNSWEGREGAADFVFTKDQVSLDGLVELTLELSGARFAKDALLTEVADVIGEPELSDTYPGIPDVTFYSWMYEGVAVRMSSEIERSSP